MAQTEIVSSDNDYEKSVIAVENLGFYPELLSELGSTPTNDELIDAISDIQEGFDRGLFEVTTQISTPASKDELPKYQVILIPKISEEGAKEITLISVDVVPNSNRSVRSAHQQIQDLLKPFNDEENKPTPLVSKIRNQISQEALDLHQKNEAGNRFKQHVQIVQMGSENSGSRPENLMRDLMKQPQGPEDSAIAAAKGRLANLFADKMQNEVDLSESKAPIQLLDFVDEYLSRILGPNMPKDLDERLDLDRKVVNVAQELHLQSQQNQLQITRINSEATLYRNIADASGKGRLSGIFANPDVMNGMITLVNALTLRMADDILKDVEDPENTARLLNQLTEIINNGAVQRMTVRDMAKAEAQKRRIELKRLEDEKNTAKSRATQLLVEEVRAERNKVDREDSSQRIIIRKEGADAFSDSIGHFMDEMGERLSKSAHGIKDFVIGPEEGVLITAVNWAGTALTKSFNFLRPLVARAETVTLSIGFVSGYEVGAYAAGHLFSSFASPNVVIGGFTLAGSALGIAFPGGVRKTVELISNKWNSRKKASAQSSQTQQNERMSRPISRPTSRPMQFSPPSSEADFENEGEDSNDDGEEITSNQSPAGGKSRLASIMGRKFLGK
jgi:hypothetical protein